MKCSTCWQIYIIEWSTRDEMHYILTVDAIAILDCDNLDKFLEPSKDLMLFKKKKIDPAIPTIVIDKGEDIPGTG